MKLLRNLLSIIYLVALCISCNRYDAPTTVNFEIGYQAFEGSVSQIVYGFLDGERKFEQKLDGTTNSSANKELPAGNWKFSAYYADPALAQDFLCEEVEIFLTGLKNMWI